MKFRLLLVSAVLAGTSATFAEDAKPATKPNDPRNKKPEELELCCDPADADAAAKADPKKDPAKPSPAPEKKK